MGEHDCGSLRECTLCGELTECHNERLPECEACRSTDTRGRAPAGRVCLVEGCETVLSIYNRTARCALHITRSTTSSAA
jgi:hypothetical protein